MSMLEFLAATEIVDWDHPDVAAQARWLASSANPTLTAGACFRFVRDEIQHSRDYQRDPATCRASDVLKHRTGYCYAKSHLLAALLRANGIPAGFCYQRLSINDRGAPFSLHGYNAVYLLEFGWYRMDARGNKTGVNAQFNPPTESLAFPLQCSDEFDFDNILAEPLQCVVDVLNQCKGWRDVLQNLPDISPDMFPEFKLHVRRRGEA